MGGTDNIFIFRKIIEKAYEYKIYLHVLFVDFKQTFDSIKRINIYMKYCNKQKCQQN